MTRCWKLSSLARIGSYSVRLIRYVGQIGVKIITRIMGLLLAGIGAQFILSGTKRFWQGL